MTLAERLPGLRVALFTSLLLTLLLPTLQRSLPGLSESMAWLILLSFALVLAFGLWQRSRHRRRFLIRHHINRDSRWFRWLGGGLLIWPGAIVTGLLLSATLLAGLLSSDALWWLMAVAPLLVSVMRRLVHRLFREALQPEALWLWSLRLGGRLSILLLVLLHTGLAMWLPQPDYAEADFSEAAARVLYGLSAQSELVSALHAAGEFPVFLFSWSIQQLMSGTENGWLLLGGWLAILAKGAVVYLPVVELSLGAERWWPQPVAGPDRNIIQSRTGS